MFLSKVFKDFSPWLSKSFLLVYIHFSYVLCNQDMCKPWNYIEKNAKSGNQNTFLFSSRKLLSHSFSLLPVQGHVDVEFSSHVANLLFVQPRECKHPDLLQDMAPITRSTFYKWNLTPIQCHVKNNLKNREYDAIIFRSNPRGDKHDWLYLLTRLQNNRKKRVITTCS
jgi:hypothetical protein